MSNYPYAIDGNTQFEILRPKQLFGKVEVENKSLINIQVFRYDKGHPLIKNRRNLLITIEINQMILNYIQLPVLRIIDFINK